MSAFIDEYRDRFGVEPICREIEVSASAYIRTWEGWSYLAIVLDIHTRRIVGWQLASHMRQSLVTDALEMAIAARKERDQATIAHSDNGGQYTSYEYTERLKQAGTAPSRGRTGTALDNAMAETVMSTLKRELTKRYVWRTRLDLDSLLSATSAGTTPGANTARLRSPKKTDSDGSRPYKCSSVTISKSPLSPWHPIERASAEPGAFQSCNSSW